MQFFQEFLVFIYSSINTIQLWHNENHHADHRIATEQYQKSRINLTGLTH